MKIAIQGHPIRGKEVIQILESLGGKNTDGLEGTYDTFYYIDDKNEICDDHKKNFLPTYKLYTLEEFKKEFPFKIGDKVIHKEFNDFFEVISFNPGSSYPYKIKGVCEFNTKSHVLTKWQPKMKEERFVTLTLDKAKEWYKKGGELREIALQAFTERELNPLPRSWEEFCENNPIQDHEAFINYASSNITICKECAGSGLEFWMRKPEKDRCKCVSQKSAEAHLAMMQLEQLRNCWWDGWEPIWDCSEKWCIRLWGNELGVGVATHIARFLTFPTNEMAREFLECFRDLIEKAKDLI